MNDTPTSLLLVILVILILLSAFFSSSETGMMSLNRYRLRHLTKQGHRGARRASQLLQRTDQLLGVILLGNNFVNILASAIATLLAVQLWGEAGIAVATIILTIVLLIFGEVTPKTLAASSPEKVAFPASFVLLPLLKVFYPAVWLINLISGAVLRLIGHQPNTADNDHLSREELRTLVHEAGVRIPSRHKDMLLSILDLEKVSVNDIMVPRNEIVGIDIEDEIDEIIQQLHSVQHTRVPVYRGNIHNIIGILHLRNAARFLSEDTPSKSLLMQSCREPYYIPENTPLHVQLLNFQQEKRRLGIVVDEYGDVLGLATLEDILEEIVGEFTTDMVTTNSHITELSDGSYLIDGATTIRVLNKTLNWNLPTDGPKTLNGLIIEALEAIPEGNICLKLHNHHVEIKQIKDNMVKTAIVSAPIQA